MTDTELFLLAIGAIFSVPYLVWRLCRTDYWAPLVVVQIIGGVLMGPGLLGAALPGVWSAVFTPPVITALNGIAWWAVMLFVFLAGIELELTQAWKYRRESALTAGLALSAPLAAGAAAATLLLLFPGWIGPRAEVWQFVLGIGMACAVTALPILVLLMEKLAILRLDLGQRILRYASLDDVAIWSVLAVILMDWQRLAHQAVFLAGYAAVGCGMRRLMPRLPASDRWSVGLIWLAFVALLADWAGLHFMVGAFLAGVVVERRWFDPTQLDFLRQHVLLVMMPVFFLSTGLRTSWQLGGFAVLGAAALLMTAQIAGKLGGLSLAGRLLGWRPGEARVIGWLLQTKALIEIIFANVLLDKALITSATFTALLLMALASTMLTTPLVTPLLRRHGLVPAKESCPDRMTAAP
jgi:Kef-type K+ transport system membrane component KefB